jgi:hypothetical protein
VKQDLSAPQQHEGLQFALDLTVQNVNTVTIIFSDESRFVLEYGHRWRHLRKGEWNEIVFVTKTKFPLSLMTWGAIGVDGKSECFFCSHAVDSEECQKTFLASELVDEMNRRLGKFQWCFMEDMASAHASADTTAFLIGHRRILTG